MGLLTTNGIILRVANFGDYDRYLSVLTPEHGLIEVLAKGARRPRFAMLRATEIFSLSAFVLFESHDRYRLNTADLIEGFSGLQTDFERMTCAAHLADVWLEVCQSADLGHPVYPLAAYTLDALARQQEPGPMAVTRACEVRVLSLAGYGFNLSRCGVCGRTMEETAPIVFSLDRCQPLCPIHVPAQQPDCSGRPGGASSGRGSAAEGVPERLIRLNPAVRSALAYFENAPLSRLYHFSIDDAMSRTLDDLLPVYLSERLERAFRKLDFLRCL